MPYKYLSRGNIINIRGLLSFANKHKELSGIENMVRQNALTFKFLNKFVDTVPYGVEMLNECCVLGKGNYHTYLIMNKNIDNLIKNHYREYLNKIRAIK